MNRSASDAASGNSEWPDDGRDFFDALCCPKCKTAHIATECPTDSPVGVELKSGIKPLTDLETVHQIIEDCPPGPERSTK